MDLRLKSKADRDGRKGEKKKNEGRIATNPDHS